MEVKISIFKLAFQIISMLIAAGADFNCVDKRGVSAGIYLFDAAALVKCGGATIFECIKYYGDKIDFTLPMFVASGKNFAVWLNGYIERCTNPQDAMYAGHEIAARIIYARLSLKTSRDKKITVCSRINQLKNKGVDLRKDVIAKEVKDMLFTPTNKYYIGDDCIAAFSRDAERCAVAATTPVPVVFSPLLLVSERGSTVRTPLEALSSGVPAVTAIFEGAQVDSIDCDRKVVKRSALEAFSADLSINTERKALCC